MTYWISIGQMEIEFENHNTWLEAAQELKLSSEVLKRKLIECVKGVYDQEALAYFNSYMLLRGYHFENYLKGKSLQIHLMDNNNKKPEKFNDLKKIWNSKNGHDLVNIYKSCDIEVKPMEKDFLERLETHIMYAGRYKTPKNESDWNTENRIIKSTDNIIEDQIKTRIELKINNYR